MRSFKDKVLEIVSNIQKGSTLSYGEVAKLAGSPKAHRAVAQIMSQNFDVKIPCHRVIRADGTPGGYNRGGEKVKRDLLKEEGYLK